MHGNSWTRLARGTAGIAFAIAVAAPVALSSTAHAQTKKPAAAAPAKTDTLEILGIVSDDVEEQADGLTEALRYQARQLPGVTVGKATQTLDVMTTANKCPQSPDPTCQQDIAKQLKTSQYIWGILKKAPDQKVTIELHHYVKDKPDHILEVSYPANLRDQNDEALRKIARRLLVELLNLKTGFVHVTGVGAMASCNVKLDGKPIGTLRDGALLSETTPGEHTISTDGCPAFTGTATVVASREVVITLTEPGKKVGPGIAPPAEEKKPYFTPRKIVAATMIGTGVAAGVVSVVFLTQYLGNRSAPSEFDNWRISREGEAALGGRSASKVCENPGSSEQYFAGRTNTVRDICNELSAAQRNSAISIITAAAGGALILGGAVLWATDPKPESGGKTAKAKPKLRLEPSFGQTSGLWLSGTF